MKTKKSSKKCPATTPEEAKLAVGRFYQALQAEWMMELQTDPTDWEHLLYLHYTIADLERRAPWLKVQA